MRSYIRYILVIDNRSNLLDTSYCQQVKLNMSLTCVGSSHRIKLVRTESTAMLGVDKTIINHSENHSRSVVVLSLFGLALMLHHVFLLTIF